MPNEDVFSFDEIKQIAVNACDGDEAVEVLDHRLEPFSKHKVGFLGNHQTLTITTRRAGDARPTTRKFFAKTVPYGSESQTAFVKQRRVFEQEAEFFNKVMPELVAAAGDLEDWAPKCYLATERFIVLEDLRDSGFAMLPVKHLEVARLRVCLGALARLHASSLLAERRLGKRLNEAYPQACVEQIFNEEAQKQGAAFMISSLVSEIAQKHGKTAEGALDAVNRAFEKVREKDELRVLCHGDSWPNNLMLDEGEPPRCRLVDFQLVRYANPMFDVAELLYLSSLREVREREEATLIEDYRRTLHDCLRRCDPEVEVPGLEELTADYEKARLTAMVNALVYFPVLLVSEEVIAEYKEDPEALYRKIVFRRNNEFIMEQMEKDALYSKMITDVALEFIEASEKLCKD